ncbi:hypothetical protein VDGD_20212 [Verticillium dahliae]|nr:hypothetical protein VDGD_20212 [Verticillium dahliae]
MLFRIHRSPSRCALRRCSRKLCCSAVRTANSANTSPMYQHARMLHGCVRPLSRTSGHEPVELRQAARSAPTVPTKLSSWSLWSRQRSVRSSRRASSDSLRMAWSESSVVESGATMPPWKMERKFAKLPGCRMC